MSVEILAAQGNKDRTRIQFSRIRLHRTLLHQYKGRPRPLTVIKSMTNTSHFLIRFMSLACDENHIVGIRAQHGLKNRLCPIFNNMNIVF